MTPYYDHKGITIYCGDCRDVLPGLGAVDVTIFDPPYNIGKAVWDHVQGYEEWMMQTFKLIEQISKDNATLWFFHMVFPVLAKLHLMIERETSFRHKQLIVIDKGLKSIAGRSSVDILRSFPRATEYLQFYTFEDRTGAEQLSEKYQKVNPMAKYLQSEFKRANVASKEIAGLFPSITGGLTGCVSNWLSGANFPRKEQYLKIREHLNGEYLRAEYEYLRAEYEDLRYCFNMPLGVTDVWNDIKFPPNDYGHETVKPDALMARIIMAASRQNDVILDCCMGSGTTLVAAKALGRKAIGIDISEEYCEIAADRLRQEVFPFRER